MTKQTKLTRAARGRDCQIRQGMLLVIERLPNSKYRCKCDCGGEKTVGVGHFNAGSCMSCGCRTIRHGHAAGGEKSREYACYHNMIARCHKPENKRYHDYGGRGIAVCERWREGFAAFISDMGECPPGYTIDRIDNLQGYAPDNCQWVTRSQNQANRSNSQIWVIRGVRYATLRQAAEKFGVSDQTIRARCSGRTARSRYYPPLAGHSVELAYGNQP